MASKAENTPALVFLRKDAIDSYTGEDRMAGYLLLMEPSTHSVNISALAPVAKPHLYRLLESLQNTHY